MRALKGHFLRLDKSDELTHAIKEGNCFAQKRRIRLFLKVRKIILKIGKNRIFGLALAISALPTVSVYADDLAGQASVIDGDTIEIHGARIRLWGIDAPESTQLCRNDDSNLYQCGRAAATALAGLLWAIKRPVQCTPVDRDQFGRTVATCQLGVPGPDIGHWLVANGHALDWRQYSKGKYSDAQRSAEQSKRGIWSGSFVEPWQYRACVKAGGRPSTCSDDADGPH
ncbi:endonuclease YncB(thermonuclease family) [Bradyrhizobium yuanmingense]|uniref:thermonuclease family protein n=1 Tax=Bradyrhizobium yuanmingense TaxID=108015 RepID=UPI00351334F9